MKKLGFYSPVLLLLAIAFSLTSTMFAQGTKPVNAASKNLTKRLQEFARQHRSAQPFVLLTPADLASLSTEERTALAFGDPCNTAAPIAFGQTVNGELTAADCQLDDGSYADFYTFNATQGQIADIRLNSAAFDTYLGLANEDGTFTAEDDDGGGGTNSRIFVRLPQTGLYIILANSVFPNTFGNYSLSLTEYIPCTYSISPTGANIPAAGGTFSVTITTQSGCQWTARTNNEDFITVNTPSGTGTGTITYTVAQNGSGQNRGGALIINNGDFIFPIQQPTLQCNFVLTPNSADFPMAGGSGTINVAVQTGCVWRVVSNNEFITASGSGSGNGTVNYTVAANTGADRSGSITIGSSAPVFFYISQTGFNCVTQISPVEIYAGKTGKTGTISVTSNCSWTVSVSDSFIQITNGAGSGSGSFNYRVLANNTGSRRSAYVRVFDGQNSYSAYVDQIGVITKVKYDYTLDGKADLAVFRPSNGAWHIRQAEQVITSIPFGASTDKIVPADYDGNGLVDVAVFRPSNGTWFFNNVRGLTAVPFGANGDIPVPADYDGDGFADIAVFRPSTGGWYIRTSSDDGFVGVIFGASEDIPTVGDYDGDGKSDIAVFRPSTGYWFRLNSSNNSFTAVPFGADNDKLVPADYDGDGKTDIAVFRPSNGYWYRLNSSDNSFTAVLFGFGTDIPTAADYDGDGKTDIAVFRPSDGNWYLLNSSNGFSAVHFGTSGDIPIQSAYIR